MVSSVSSAAPAAFLFDMDHTLINNDCDVSWKEFLMRAGLAPADSMEKADFFFAQYRQGRLDVPAFLRFQLAEFAGRTPAAMARLARRHFTAVVRPKIYVRGRRIVARALATGRPVALLTATNVVVARPLAQELGIRHLLGTQLEQRAGRFTGNLSGPYSGGTGKVLHAEAFCRKIGVELAQVTYYGDSLSDVPMLEAVGFPMVVNPGAELRRIAVACGWKVLRFAAIEGNAARVCA